MVSRDRIYQTRAQNRVPGTEPDFSLLLKTLICPTQLHSLINSAFRNKKSRYEISGFRL